MKNKELFNTLMEHTLCTSNFVPDDVKRTEILKMISEDELDKLLYSEESFSPSNHLNYLYSRQIFTMVCLNKGISPKTIRKTIKYWDEL